MSREEKARVTELRILENYNTSHPHFAYCSGGLRRISVDPHDSRVRNVLLPRNVRSIAKNHCFVFACIKFLPVDIFLDIGVNYGECLFSVPLFCETRLLGYEANADLMPFIERSMAYNDDLRNVEITWSAIGDTVGTIDFFVDTQWSGKSSAHGNANKPEIVKHSVPCSTIDRELADEKNLNLILVKVDVEGFEPKVLRGASQTCSGVPNVIFLIEFDSNHLARGNHSPEEFVAELTDIFEVYNFKKSVFSRVHSIDDIEYHDPIKKRHHTDLVLVKFQDKDIEATFRDNILSSSVGALGAKLFKA